MRCGKLYIFLGYMYVMLNIIVVINVAIQWFDSFESEYENNTFLALEPIFALLSFPFSIILAMGIRQEKLEYITVYRHFVLFRSVCALFYMVIRQLIVIFDNAATGHVVKLILAVLVCTGFILVERWFLGRIKSFVELLKNTVEMPSGTPI